jgi:hypothetical protein
MEPSCAEGFISFERQKRVWDNIKRAVSGMAKGKQQKNCRMVWLYTTMGRDATHLSDIQNKFLIKRDTGRATETLPKRCTARINP